MKFNVNDTIKVRLNARGIAIMEKHHNELRLRIPAIKEFKAPAVDDHGYSSFQLWAFMQEFGPYMVLGLEVPFDSEIIIPEKK